MGKKRGGASSESSLEDVRLWRTNDTEQMSSRLFSQRIKVFVWISQSLLPQGLLYTQMDVNGNKTFPLLQCGHVTVIRPINVLLKPAVILTLFLYKSTNTSLPCVPPNSGSLEYNCSLTCPCLNLTECVRPFVCPSGCREGPAGCAEVRLERGESGPHPFPRRSVADSVTYRFSSTESCVMVPAEQAWRKRWEVTTNVTIAVEHIAIVLGVNPSEEEAFYVTFISRLHGNPSSFQVPLDFTLVNSSVTLSQKLKRLTIANFLLIESVSSKNDTMCLSDEAAEVTVKGQPVCAYGTWGAMCDQTCRCPCDAVECHPSNGNCWERGYACSHGLYGPSCSKTCSAMCGGSPRECHLSTGVCKKCEDGVSYGTRCEIRMTPEEIESKDIRCKELQDKQEMQQPEVKWEPERSKMDSYVKSGSSVPLIIATIIVTTAFLVVCVAYVMLIRHCASQKLRKYQLAVDERDRRLSMVSYTELRKEYAERFMASSSPRADSRNARASPENLAQKTSVMFAWSSPLLAVIKDVPENKGTQPGLASML
ncbi:hypothetical protein Bpfe_009964 [Biomphalaria pfeifferi]|uniref:EGF-like domain-containing protein n=1 Tax=Biomphalaria pfeifferi TaxID=112525 RepID=A0AAD8BTN8_BIOPF|nr:hypothetical protein Bpfe_009964 [Biomphalaria pfeifferi]